LISKLGDNNAKLKQKSGEALMISGPHRLIGFDMIVDRILTASDVSPNKSKSKIMNTTGKHLVGHMEILEQIVDKQNYREKKIDADRISKYCVNHLQSNNAGVRYHAYMVLIAIYK
jgi:uncharacterized protein (DUF2252 family)